MNPLRLLLLPLALLYALLVELRNLLYDLGLFKSYRPGCPTISVGNITAGGTGKTPFVIALARKLQRAGKRVAIISRGYGRSTRGLQWVSDGQNIKLSPEQSGDEPWLMARRLPGALLLVCEKRVTAVKEIEDKVDVIILDDAFQHRALKRDLDIVLISRAQPWRFNFVLPAGTLREPKYRLKRAGLLVETHNADATPRSYRVTAPVCTAEFQTDAVLDIQFERVDIEQLKGQSVLAFAGIAQPQAFFDALISHGLKIRATRTFRDHAVYKEPDINALLRASKEQGCRYLICTEKDLVKISSLAAAKEILGNAILFALAGETHVNDCPELAKKVQTILDIKI